MGTLPLRKIEGELKMGDNHLYVNIPTIVPTPIAIDEDSQLIFQTKLVKKKINFRILHGVFPQYGSTL